MRLDSRPAGRIFGWNDAGATECRWYHNTSRGKALLQPVAPRTRGCTGLDGGIEAARGMPRRLSSLNPSNSQT